MLKHSLRAGLVARAMSCRFVSQNAPKNEATVADAKNELSKKGDPSEFSIESIPKSAKDNFLIEFKKRKPSYDQLFEYQIDEKPHLKAKPLIKSMLSPDFKIFLHRKYDFSWKAFKRILDNRIFKSETTAQQYLTRRHGILGKVDF